MFETTHKDAIDASHCSLSSLSSIKPPKGRLYLSIALRQWDTSFSGDGRYFIVVILNSISCIWIPFFYDSTSTQYE